MFCSPFLQVFYAFIINCIRLFQKTFDAVKSMTAELKNENLKLVSTNECLEIEINQGGSISELAELLNASEM